MGQRKRSEARHALRAARRFATWPLQGCVLALLWAWCAAMRPERAATFGAWLGRALGPRFRWHRRLRDNLAIALPDATGGQVEALTRAVWGSFGATLAEYAHFKSIADRDFQRYVEVVLHPRVEGYRGGGRPFIFVTAHLGNWEISAATARHLGLPLTVVYSPQANPVLEWLVQRQRRHLGCRFLPADSGMRRLLQELRAGRSIGLLVDVRVATGDDLPFCGHATTTTLVPARLALKFACPLVPVRVERLQPAHLRVTLFDPVPLDEDTSPDLQAHRMMANVNALFESWIVARPHEWQCFQNRWPKSTRTRALQARARRQPASAPVPPSRAARDGARSTTSKTSWRT